MSDLTVPPNDLQHSKTCSVCGTAYPATLEFFYKQIGGRNGLKARCKTCTKAGSLHHQREHPEMLNARVKRHYERNRNNILSRLRIQYQQNPTPKLEAAKHYRTNNPEKNVNRALLWAKTNPGKHNANGQRYRARKKGAGGTFTEAEVQALYEQQQGKCFHCGCELNGKFDRDHWIPLSRGGSNLISNIRLLCEPCNSSKHNKLPHEWSDRYGEA